MKLATPYFFMSGTADGSGDMRDLLGGKGANLSEMCKLSLPVPPGFILTTEMCREYYTNGRRLPSNFTIALQTMIAKIEEITGKKFDGETDPLLLSVRSGAAQSMPGMMDTILNVGISTKSLRGLLKTYDKNSRFVYDSYKRLIQMYSVVVLGLNDFDFEELLDEFKIMNNIKTDSELNSNHLLHIINIYTELVKKETGKPFPDNAYDQLTGAIQAVFDSWTNARAQKYREIHKISHDGGTAVVVQAMVFGNMNNDSASGVLFSRDPSTGERRLFGEYLINSQGEDIVAGIRTPHSINNCPESLESKMPHAYNELRNIAAVLETHYKDMQDIEYTVENNKLWILQTRRGKRSVPAAVKIAVDMHNEGLISKEEAILKVAPEELGCLFYPIINKEKSGTPVLTGLPASPGSASGVVVFDSIEAEKIRATGKKVILFRIETSPEDISGMNTAEAIVTAKGGMTSHAAVVTRGMGKPCICGATELSVNYAEKCAELHYRGQTHTIYEGDVVTVSGDTGELFLGVVPLIEPVLTGDFYILMQWCDEIKTINIRANADTLHDYETAIKFGATGIGLCRTEHMFFEETKLAAMRCLIMSQDDEKREEVLKELIEIQRRDFYAILRCSEAPVTIRLLDPPLHEFISDNPTVLRNISLAAGITENKALAVIESLREINPMLGTRGIRLAVVHPAIYEMQIRAIFLAASDVLAEGIQAKPEIMVPFVFCAGEMEFLRNMTDKIAKEIMGAGYQYKLGSMIELPRAAIVADQIARHVDFLSFGTNDLTQTTFGISRDDSAKFLGEYIKKGILLDDPFHVLDEEGVGGLIKITIQKALAVNPNLTFGICGEHGAHPRAMKFFRDVGINYVSCSPYGVAKSRLAAARIEVEKLRREKTTLVN